MQSRTFLEDFFLNYQYLKFRTAHAQSFFIKCFNEHTTNMFLITGQCNIKYRLAW